MRACLSCPVLCLVLLAAGNVSSAQQEKTVKGWQVLKPSDQAVPPGRLLKQWALQRCQQALRRRQEAFEKLDSPQACLHWMRQRQEFFRRQLGGFPRRTPLRARVVGTLQGQGFRVEKILFESQPGHYVTALLYLPTRGKGPFPGVLEPCGHSINGKAATAYQQAAMLMARNGIAVLCYDPIGQGERYQILRQNDQEPAQPRAAQYHPRARFLSTTEHTLVGIGAMLLGSSTARYRIWDGMRALDYLQSRPEVDPKRLGCTGNSGGGTLTSYLMALDERIWVAAPACYLTDFEHLLPQRGPQDGEQNIFGQVAFGMNHADYVLMRAPKPTLILAATFDGFAIEGTWNTFRQAKRFYGLLGYPERVELVEARAPHGFSRLLREGAARWMLRHLREEPREVFEEPMTPFEENQLRCTPQGQVMLLPGARSVIDLNRQWEQRLRPRRRQAWSQLDARQRRRLVRRTAGVRPLEELPELKATLVAKETRPRFTLQKWVFSLHSGLPIPAVLLVPKELKGPPVLWLHPQGKARLAAGSPALEHFLAQGRPVLAADLPGCGETRPGERNWAADYFGPLYDETMLLYLLGESMVGLRAEHTLALARWLQARPEFKQQTRSGVLLVAHQELTVPALHAAALEPQLFLRVELVRGIRSWAEVVETPVPRNQLVNVVHGALRHYDLPELVDLAGKGRVELIEPADPQGRTGQRR